MNNQKVNNLDRYQKMKKILLISPHTDDCEFGMGATISRFVEEGASIHWMILSNAVKSLPPQFGKDTLLREQKASAETLGIDIESLSFFDFPVRNFDSHRQDILEEMVKLKRDFQPSFVFCPSSNDIHQDHAVVHKETIRAFKNINIFGYDLPWNYTEQNMNYSVKIQERHLIKKLNALKCFNSQSDKKYMDEEYIKSVVRFRALNTPYEMCETYECIRSYYD